MAGVEALDGLAGGGKFAIEGEPVEVGCGGPAVAADEDAALGEEVGGGQPDGAGAFHDELEAAVDVVVLLPEAAALPGHFVGARIGGLLDDLLDGRAEVAGDLLEDGERQGTEAICGFEGAGLAGLGVGDSDAGGGAADSGDGGVVADELSECLGERSGDLVHAADGLEHGGLHVEGLVKEHALPEVFVEQGVHIKGLEENASVVARAGLLGVTGAVAAGVLAGLVE